ncbi:TylF/MycF/NovP-related O-methyltransferase [Lacrimispora sp.]|jgi:O-methyltransferase|uniref:TylF/MycF/NovP-related O-methyltransferase n=1 Tax=Lacrimispora sp. TaxID=2719234 RepID=UPI00289F6816|nr:TylF/MycF/NovP-related O-methyltransferase [Lacrimispora sp.]
MQRAIMFGAGGGGKRLYDIIRKRYEVIAITDNDSRKWGETFKDLIIDAPKDCLKKQDYDVVVVSSAPGLSNIVKQLNEYSIEDYRVITSYVSQPLESRMIFLKNVAMLMQDKNNNAAVAEAGVFQGDFAKYINEYFFGRKLYLFDTFEGFASKDIVFEENGGFSSAEASDYNNTNEEMVLAKMKYPNLCVVKKGYFPETAIGIDEEFCFVNLDMDLYQPTSEGLRWFSKRMVRGGIILVHDYFADNFRGVKIAVDEFVQDANNNLSLMPIGDGVSIAICGF